MTEVIMIPENQEIAVEDKRKVRVAAYCRVSSLPQEESYASQVEHFTSYISTHSDWELVRIYGDEGVTGLNTKKRSGFQRMLRDGRNKKFDLLLVKSISRMGRNTVDLLQAVRDLKKAGVRVFFEKEQLATDAVAGELMLTMLSAFAQMESESISANVRVGLGYRMQRGEWTVAFSKFLGYDRTESGEVVINDEQAETVRLIFDWFLQGVSLAHIAEKLKKAGRKTGTGATCWNKASVKRILQNRKYCGDVVLQITVMEDLLTKRRVYNTGQAPQYIVTDGIPAIVSRQTFFLAQGELERRGRMLTKTLEGPDVTAYHNLFTGKIRCGCGANYNRCNARNHYVWKCRNRIYGQCKSEILSEAELQLAVLKAAQTLWDRKPSYVLHEIPILKSEDSMETMAHAARLHMENVFAERMQEFMDAERPRHFEPDIVWMVDLIQPGEDGFLIRFYGGEEVLVRRDDRISIPPVEQEPPYIVKPPSCGKRPVMENRFHVTGEVRKRLVRRLATLTGGKVSYQGFPTMAYMVGDLLITRDGTVEGRLSKRVLRGLARSGFKPEEENVEKGRDA